MSFPALFGCVIDRSIAVGPGERRGATRIIDGDLDVAGSGGVDSVRMIDGDVTLRGGASVAGRAHITDGRLVMLPGARIGGDLVAHHAELRLTGGRIEGDVELYCTGGSIDDTRIAAAVRVRGRALWHVRCDAPRPLVIGPGSEIGRLVVEAQDAEVRVSDEATVGTIEGPATVTTPQAR